MTEVITVSAVGLRDDSGSILTVRKRGTSRFMSPGGKPEPGESARDAAIRECAEELGVRLDPESLRPLGVFRAAAANEVGREVEATVFEHPPVPIGEPAAEIDEVRWLDTTAGPLPDDVAPLLAEHVIPALSRPDGHRLPRRLTVFTGSATGTRPVYQRAVARLAEAVTAHGVGLVYGGGKVGLMGAIADAALAAGGEVIGVMPRDLVDREIAHGGLSRLEIVADLGERKSRMAALGDAFVALPGGSGTLDEFFEVWTWQQLGIHAKPVVLYDVDDFWSPLRAMVDRMVSEGFLSAAYRDSLGVAQTPEDLLSWLRTWRPSAIKWR